ncbi:MAG: DUF559 domain-containing protein [Nanoarchaeota archaeon]
MKKQYKLCIRTPLFDNLGIKQSEDWINKRVGNRKKNNNYIHKQTTKDKISKSNSIFYNTEKGKNIQRERRFKQNTSKTSKGQLKFYYHILNKFPSAILNYPLYKYIIDVYIPEYKICLEYDGDYWHSRPEVKERDSIKDKYLKENKYTIIHVNEHVFKKICP